MMLHCSIVLHDVRTGVRRRSPQAYSQRPSDVVGMRPTAFNGARRNRTCISDVLEHRVPGTDLDRLSQSTHRAEPLVLELPKRGTGAGQRQRGAADTLRSPRREVGPTVREVTTDQTAPRASASTK